MQIEQLYLKINGKVKEFAIVLSSSITAKKTMSVPDVTHLILPTTVSKIDIHAFFYIINAFFQLSLRVA